MELILTFLTIIAYICGGVMALVSLVGLITLFTRGRVFGLGLLLWAVPSGIIPWAFMLARYLCR